jgi:hypothetical protein
MTSCKRGLRIPKKLRIDGKIWRVRKSSTLLKREGNLGMCVPSDRYISISTEQTRLESEETFLHEILHSVFPNNLVGDATEEKIVESLSVALYDVLINNKLVK